MLVLSRKAGETVVVRDDATGERIEISISEVNSNGRVRIGFAASQRFTIFRSELEATSDFYRAGTAAAPGALPAGRQPLQTNPSKI